METYRLTREVPAEEGFDVLVAGGGPAGTAAAVCAARLGARVLLVEATGCLGGMGTSGLVSTFGPMADGKRTLVGGFARELIETMYQRDFLGPLVTPEFWTTHLNRWIPFQPEGLKRLLDEYVVNADVEVRFFTRLIDAEVQGREVQGVVLSNVEGYRFVRAKTYIDATGDAILADACGADCIVAGRDYQDIAPSTLCSLYAGIDWNDPAYAGGWRRRRQGQGRRPQPAIAAGYRRRAFLPARPLHAGHEQARRIRANLNGGHIFGLNGLNTRSLSEGMIFGRKLAVEYTEFFRKYVPGCANIEHLTTSSLMGVRDTRRIVGEFELKIHDFRARRQFPDQIAVYNRPTDVHPTDASEKEYQRFLKDFDGSDNLGRGEYVGIPYSILVPQGWSNLWAAGRCHSSDTRVHGSIRAQSAAYMMGKLSGRRRCSRSKPASRPATLIPRSW